MTDAECEKMAEDIYEALEPIQNWFKKLNRGHDPAWLNDAFIRAHEDTELLLMKLVDRYYGNGFKDGAAEERYISEASELGYE